MTGFATIGATAAYLLFLWLLSAAGAAWVTERKGYGERLGLSFGLILTFVGFLIVLLLPSRPGSAWRHEGPLPRRRRHAEPGPPGQAAATAAGGSGEAPRPPGPDQTPPPS